MSKDNQTLILELPQASRRALLASAPAAAVAALAGGAITNAAVLTTPRAGEVDPIFEAIERLRTALEHHDAAWATRGDGRAVSQRRGAGRVLGGMVSRAKNSLARRGN
jgi:hypothetical protein